MLALVLQTYSTAAWAKKRVVVLGFTGSGVAVQKGVAEILAEDHTLVSEGAFLRTAKRLDVEPDNAAGYAQTSADLEVDAVVSGRVHRVSRRWRAVVVVRDGVTGKATATFTLRLRSARRLRDAERKQLAGQLVRAIAATGSAEGRRGDAAAAEPPESTTGERPPRARASDADEGRPRRPPSPDRADGVEDGRRDADDGTGDERKRDTPRTARTDETEDDEAERDEAKAGAEGEQDDGGSTAKPLGTRSPRERAVDVGLGLAVVQRTMSFTAADNLTNAEKPNGYRGALVPAVVLTGEVYPLALDGRASPLDSLGLALTAEHVLFLRSRLGSAEYSTSQTRLGAGLRYRHRFGRRSTAPTVKAAAGYNQLSFQIERGDDDIDFPNVTYRYLDLGASGRFPIRSPRVAVYLDARYLAVLSSGEIESRQFYGGGSVLGLEADAGFEVRPTSRQSIKLGMHYQRIAFDFDGSGQSTTMRDGDPDQDVDGAVDRYLGGYLTFGYLF